MVEAGDLLYEIDPAPFEATLRNAQAALKRAEGAVPGASARFKRYQTLSAGNAISRQEFDEAQTQLLQVEADVAAATAAVETARINLEFTKVTAPIGGRIDASVVTEGALVTENQETALTTIRQLDVINVDLVRTSSSLLSLNRALAAKNVQSNGDFVTVELLLEDGSPYPHPGRLQFKNAVVSSSTGMISLRATFPNPEGVLLPGMYVRAIVEDGYLQDSFLLPQRAVSRNARGEATAKFIDANMKIEERVLPVAQNVRNSWLVSSGVRDGDRIVVDGLQRAVAGQEVDAIAVTIDDTTSEIHKVVRTAPESRTTGRQAASTRADGTLVR